MGRSEQLAAIIQKADCKGVGWLAVAPAMMEISFGADLNSNDANYHANHSAPPRALCDGKIMACFSITLSAERAPRQRSRPMKSSS